MEPFDKGETRDLVREVERIAALARQSYIYRRASDAAIMWGALTALGYLNSYFFRNVSSWVWTGLLIFGAIGTTLILRIGRPASARRDWRWTASILIFIGFGYLWSSVLASMDGRQLSAFWPSYFMMMYVIAGLWVGLAFAAIGLAVIGATMAGYYWSGAYFPLYMAFLEGLGLIGAGLWMRRL